MKQTIKHISNSNKKFAEEIKGGRGWNHFVRAITAKILFVSLIYSTQHLLLPQLSNYKVVSFLAGWGVVVLLLELWNHIFREHCPDWIDDIISGNIFFKIDIKELNLYIIGLSVANLFLIFIPQIVAILRLKTYEKK